VAVRALVDTTGSALGPRRRPLRLSWGGSLPAVIGGSRWSTCWLPALRWPLGWRFGITATNTSALSPWWAARRSGTSNRSFRCRPGVNRRPLSGPRVANDCLGRAVGPVLHYQITKFGVSPDEQRLAISPPHCHRRARPWAGHKPRPQPHCGRGSAAPARLLDQVKPAGTVRCRCPVRRYLQAATTSIVLNRVCPVGGEMSQSTKSTVGQALPLSSTLQGGACPQAPAGQDRARGPAAAQSTCTGTATAGEAGAAFGGGQAGGHRPLQVRPV